MPGAMLGTLAVKLRADTAEFANQMDGASKKMEGVSAAAAKIAKISGAAFAALSGVGLIAVKIAADFESGMVRVKAVAQATAGQFGQLKGAAMELASATQFTAREVAEGMGFMAMAGFETNEIIGTMPSVLNLAAAGMIDLGDAADITTNILTGMGLEVEELGMVNDVLVSAMTGANVNTRMLGEAFKYVGPVAKSAGVSFKEITASIAMLGNVGIQGSMAGTTLRFAIASLLKPTSEAKKVIEQLGLKTKDSTGNLLSLTDIVGQLETAGATTAEIMGLFGLRAGPGMAALIDQGAGALETFITRLEESGGIAESIAKENLATLTGRLKILNSGIERVAISIGDELIPIAKDIVSMAQSMVDWFNNLSDTTRKWIVWIGVAATGLLGVTAAATGFIAISPVLLAYVGSLAAAFGTLAVALAAAAPWLAAVGVAAAAAAVLMVGYRDISKTTTSDISLMWRQLGEDIRDVLGVTETDVERTADTIGATFKGMLDDVKSYWDEAVEYWKNTALGRLLKDIRDFSIDSLKQWSWLGDQIIGEYEATVDQITKLWDWFADSYWGQLIESIARTVADVFGGVITGIVAGFRGLIGQIDTIASYWGKKAGLIEDLTFEEKSARAIAEITAMVGPETAALMGFGAPGAAKGPPGKPPPGKPPPGRPAAKAVEALGDLAEASIDAAETIRKEFAGVTSRLLKIADKTLGGIDALIKRRLLPGPGDVKLAPPAMPRVRIGVRSEKDVLAFAAAAAAEKEKEGLYQELVKKVAKGTATVADQIGLAGHIFAHGIMKSMGDLGQLISTGMEGFKTGGPWGAAAAVLADLVTRSESFKVSVQNANDAVARVVEALEPLAKNMMPLAAILNELMVIVAEQLGPVFAALQPVFDFLFDVIKWVGIALLNVFIGIGKAWNWLIRGLENLINKIPGINIDLGRLEINLGGVHRALENLRDITVSSARAEQLREEEDKKLAETVRGLNEALTNVAEGYKVEAARYQAINAEEDTTGGGVGVMGVAPVVINIFVDDAESAVDRIVEEFEKRGHETKGNRIGGLQYAFPTGGA